MHNNQLKRCFNREAGSSTTQRYKLHSFERMHCNSLPHHHQGHSFVYLTTIIVVLIRTPTSTSHSNRRMKSYPAGFAPAGFVAFAHGFRAASLNVMELHYMYMLNCNTGDTHHIHFVELPTSARAPLYASASRESIQNQQTFP